MAEFEHVQREWEQGSPMGETPFFKPMVVACMKKKAIIYLGINT